jgi:tRNA nucleotidyltransferase/poly(A) polymerase
VEASPDTKVLLEAVLAVLGRRSFQGWLVGGSVRDRQLGRPSTDLDVCVAGVPAGEGPAREAAFAVAREVAADLSTPFFTLSHEFGAYRVVGRGATLDLTALRRGGLEADLGLRDFTVNAMALPLGGGPLVDPFHGKDDLSAGRLTAVSSHIFRDDPARLMRAVRFAHTLRLEPDESLRNLAIREAGLVVKAAPERIMSELSIALEGGDAAGLVCRLRDAGLLSELIPEVDRLAVLPNAHGTPLLGAALERLRRLERLLRRPVEPPFQAAEVREHLAGVVDGSMSVQSALCLAALLLDVGRSVTAHRLEDGSWDYPGAAREGARAVRSIALRLRLSGRVVALVVSAVEGRERLSELAAITVSNKELVRTLRALEPRALEVAAIMRAEAAATGDRLLARAAEQLAGLWLERRRRGVPRVPVDGNDIRTHLCLGPGRLLGRVVGEVAVAAEAGLVSDRDGALAYAQEVLAGLGRESCYHI